MARHGGVSATEFAGLRAASHHAARQQIRVAAAAFRAGRLEPVALPPVGYWLEGSGYEVAMSNGMTRTFWLLANRVRSFPVSVDNATRHDAEQHGRRRRPPIAYRELFSRHA